MQTELISIHHVEPTSTICKANHLELGESFRECFCSVNESSSVNQRVRGQQMHKELAKSHQTKNLLRAIHERVAGKLSHPKPYMH